MSARPLISDIFVETASSGIAARIARSLPGASFELEALVRIVGIIETTSIPSAAVSCSGRSRLLINPEFVQRWCQQDEHLFLLIMHEMWHVLLGHTTLYPRTTIRHNIAFDAVINAGLARQHPEPQYRGFFEEINSPDEFPQLLLRPPRNWPHSPEYKVKGPRGTRDVLRRLYPPADAQSVLMPTYEEVLALLDDVLDDNQVNLLGDHRAEGQSADPMNDPAFGDAVRRIVESWPPPPVPMRGRDAGGQAVNTWVQPIVVASNVRREFTKALEKVLRPDAAGARSDAVEQRAVQVGPGPLPNEFDRAQHAKRRLGQQLVLPNQRLILPMRSAQPPMRALVYLDVSGSMSQILPYLTDLLLPTTRRGLTRLLQFSTVVQDLPLEELASGKITTSVGTSIDCVLADMLTRPERRVLLLTDGYVGKPNSDLLEQVKNAHFEIVTVLPVGGWRPDLTPYTEIVELPRLGGEGDLW